jgi:hypothetical protein
MRTVSSRPGTSTRSITPAASRKAVSSSEVLMVALRRTPGAGLPGKEVREALASNLRHLPAGCVFSVPARRGKKAPSCETGQHQAHPGKPSLPANRLKRIGSKPDAKSGGYPKLAKGKELGQTAREPLVSESPAPGAEMVAERPGWEIMPHLVREACQAASGSGALPPGPGKRYNADRTALSAMRGAAGAAASRR